MGISKRIYIDCHMIEEFLNYMTEDELIIFLNKRVVIPIDDKSYDILSRLKDINKINIKNVEKD